MSNTTNLQPDGSRWKLLQGESPTGAFQSWGTEAIHYPGDNGGRGVVDSIAMIRLEDGWHYAHVAEDKRSVYAAKEAFDCNLSGEAAWAAHEMQVAKIHLECAERELEACRAKFSTCQNEYAAALARMPKTAKVEGATV